MFPIQGENLHSRYDVKYGSAGFNSFGYKGGCEFSTGSYSSAIAAPAASRYLCPNGNAYDRSAGVLDKNYGCLHDLSGDGVCWNYANSWDGFPRVLPVCIADFDLQN